MARPMEKIVDINDTKELWKVAVRVAHKWKVVSNNKEHFEMIFQDKEGCDIHVVVPTACMAAYNEKFEVDRTYTVSNFAVQPNNLIFKPSSHNFLVKFTGGTAVGDVDKHDIPLKPRPLTSFPDIINGNFQKNLLIVSLIVTYRIVLNNPSDVIGMLESVGYQQTQSGGKKCQANFLLRDASNNTVNCTLWEDYAKQFFKFTEDKAVTSGPIVVFIQYAKVKEAGHYPLSVTNTFHVTKLRINSDLPIVKDFLNSFPKESLRAVSTQLTSQSQQYSRTSTTDNVRQSHMQKLLKGAISVPISEMKKIRESKLCATVAKTNKLIASSHGWYYQCCHECTKSVRGDKPPYKCDNGHSTEVEIYKYKIEVEGYYLQTSCKFIFWDRECTDILHVSAAHMRDTMIKAGITDPLEFPLDLDAMLDLDLALRVKWQPSWDSASVIMFIKDDEFVKQLKAPWADTQVVNSEPSVTPLPLQIKESVDEAKTDAADDCDVPTDLEITSKHNPEPLTPTAKRQSHGGTSESTSVFDGELSSTKLKKIIKLEKTK
ncbi:uncharacterized protein LOC131624386 [Vicia villosa]|uniref:uncharacterized protein LOC131624386 n=1 Tax=Vicia villosa TaxID=3911 RepID=UPI00273BEC59|nr:uncharacterized protein LOC131624386 [Vicia villosa]